MTTTKNLSAFFGVLALAIFSVAGIANAEILNRSLDVGMSGSDVSALQSFLAKDATLYPQGLVTGYFGNLTAAAVTRFQVRNGIDPVGRVGPITRVALNAQMSGNVGADVNAPRIWGVIPTVRANSASIQWNTTEQAAGIVYYGTSWPSMTDTLTDATIGGSVAMTDTLLRTSQNVSLSGLQNNTTYYYVIYTRDGSGNVQLTWPSTFRTN